MVQYNSKQCEGCKSGDCFVVPPRNDGAGFLCNNLLCEARSNPPICTRSEYGHVKYEKVVRRHYPLFGVIMLRLHLLRCALSFYPG